MSAQTSKCDVLVLGAGPCGLFFSACLARLGYKIKHIDKRPESTRAGRADGIQPRSLEVLYTMGLMDDIMINDPGKIEGVAFWGSCETGLGISRTAAWPSWPDSIGARFPFTTTLHQGLIEGVLIQDLKRQGVTIQRPWHLEDFDLGPEEHTQASQSHPVHISIKDSTTESIEHIRAKYLFSGEGTRSMVRERLGIQMSYRDSSDMNIWGVIDARISTDFPDVKLKCNIRSDAGSMMIIPREAGLTRFYIQLNPQVGVATTMEDSKIIAQNVLSPYIIHWGHVQWYSHYRVRQGVAKSFASRNHRVFLAGDACHTHSPKAGQGMNTAFFDAHNLAWKIHAVESGFALRSTLQTYESERMHVAKTLIDFDSVYSTLFSQNPRSRSISPPEDDEFIRVFKSSIGFNSGYKVSYPPNVFNFDVADALPTTRLSRNFFANDTQLLGGHVFPPLDVTRVSNTKLIHLEQAVPMNGAYRIYIFAGSPGENITKRALEDLCLYSLHPKSYLSSFLRPDKEFVGWAKEAYCLHSLFYTFYTIFAAHVEDKNIESATPEFLKAYRDQIYVDEISGPAAPDPDEPHIGTYARIGVLVERPVVVVVRPDGYVGCTILLMEGPSTVQALNTYFGRFVTAKLGNKVEGEIVANL